MRTLTFSTLYPNQARPRHGIFVEQRLRHLLATGKVESRVVAPSPWFPFAHPRFGQYGIFARVPRLEERYAIQIAHPQYPLLPKIGLSSAPLLMAAASRPVVEEMIGSGFDFDVIDAHYLYPDGVAAMILGIILGKPVVASVLGDDVITYPRYRVPRQLLLWAVRQSAGITTVCQALKDRLVAWGAPPEKIRVVLHGVDPELFRPVDRAAVRRRLGLAGTVLVSVGHLTPRKGHHLAIRALADLPGTTLLIVGDGGYEGPLRELAAALRVEDRVRFLGQVEQENLKDLYGAADALVLASSREGIANVLLEAMSCGTPVIATAVWGTPEVVDVPEAGVLMAERSAGGLVAAAHKLFDRYPDRSATRRHAGRFRWEQTSQEQLEVLNRALRASVSFAGGSARFHASGAPAPRPAAWRAGKVTPAAAELIEMG